MSSIVVINPGGRKQTYQNLDVELTAIEPPIWAGLITSYLIKKNIDTRIIDSNGLGLDEVETAQMAIKENPTLIVVVTYGHNPSASTQTMPSTSKLLKAISENNFNGKTLVVGGHPAALPEKTLEEEVVDFVCTGEGPVTILKLYEELISHSPNINKVPSLCYFQENTIQKTPPAPLIQDLDNELPGLPWDQLPMENYICHNWHGFGMESRKPYASIYTTLGCPYNCDFCCIQAPFRDGEKAISSSKEINSYRRWSPSTIISQIDCLVRDYNVKNIKFADELFVLNKKHVEEVCNLLIERNYDLNIWAYSRVDTITSDLAKILRKAGVRWICLGIETFNEDSLNSVNKQTLQQSTKSAIKILKDNDINIIGNFIFGLPEDTIESMTHTLEQAMSFELDFVNFYSAMAYPGSKLYQQAINQKIPLPKTWNGFSQHSKDCLPMSTKYITGAEVLKFRDEAFHNFFESTQYLDYVKTKFGAKTRNDIIKMAEIKLDRSNIP